MALTDMKRSKKERKNEAKVMAIDENPYPYGLSISLDDESLKKLGIKKLPNVGDKMSITSVGCVRAVRENRNERRTDRNVEIQIEKMDVKRGPAGSAEDAVSEAIKDA